MMRFLLIGALLTLATASTAQEAGDGDAGSAWRMTEAEGTQFAEAVGACWTVEASYRMVTVRVRFGMEIDGTVTDGLVDLLEARGGDDPAQNDAYEAVRRAILRCQGRGYDLPAEKYEVWREVELTFDGRNGRPPE